MASKADTATDQEFGGKLSNFSKAGGFIGGNYNSVC